MKVFADIAGQERACTFLQAALDEGQVTHAYLLIGPSPGETADIALRFASGVLAGQDAEAFGQAMRGVHPDMHVYEPGGAATYLIEQVRSLVRDAELAPVRSHMKVYIIKEADRLSGAPANALLKTLEEPPRDVVCILTALSEHGVLETVRSRCEVLRLAPGRDMRPDDAAVFEIMGALAQGASNRYVLAAAKRMVERSSAGAEELDDCFAEQLEEQQDYLSAGARRELEAQHKREKTAHVRRELLAQVAAARSWLRDCLLHVQGAGELAAHAGQAPQTAQVAAALNEQRLLKALDAVYVCEERIAYNVTPQLAIEALLFEVREALCQ